MWDWFSLDTGGKEDVQKMSKISSERLMTFNCVYRVVTAADGKQNDSTWRLMSMWRILCNLKTMIRSLKVDMTYSIVNLFEKFNFKSGHKKVFWKFFLCTKWIVLKSWNGWKIPLGCFCQLRKGWKISLRSFFSTVTYLNMVWSSLL